MKIYSKLCFFRRGSESQLVLHCSSRTTTFESVTLFLSTPNSDFSVISHEKKTKKNWNFFKFFLKKLKKIIKNRDFWAYFFVDRISSASPRWHPWPSCRRTSFSGGSASRTCSNIWLLLRLWGASSISHLEDSPWSTRIVAFLEPDECAATPFCCREQRGCNSDRYQMRKFYMARSRLYQRRSIKATTIRNFNIFDLQTCRCNMWYKITQHVFSFSKSTCSAEGRSGTISQKSTKSTRCSQRDDHPH